MLGMLKVIELLIESEILVAWLPKRCLVFLEELQGRGSDPFLAGVDQRHAGQRMGEHRECVRKVAEPFEFRAFPGVQVMVCDHVHQDKCLSDTPSPGCRGSLKMSGGMFLGEFPDLFCPARALKVYCPAVARFR